MQFRYEQVNYLDFTAEETNLIAIYTAGDSTPADVTARMEAALPHMDKEMREIAERSVAMLVAMSDEDFHAVSFALVDETDLKPDEAA